jgi:quercetin dioxygenase-like cupin family protein
MHVFDLKKEQQWNPKQHVEKILGKMGEGDVTVACWEPGQISPYHCHPHATEIYFCYEGGGKMRTPTRTIDVVPGSFVVHPEGELHEYINGPQRTLLFRVRYGDDMSTRHMENRHHKDWKQRPEDAEFFRAHPALVSAEVA